MKRLLADVNVLLDVLLARQPRVAVSAPVWAAVETATVEGLAAAHAVTTLHCVVRKEQGAARARRHPACTMSRRWIGGPFEEGLELPFTDFGDAVTATAARAACGDFVVTRIVGQPPLSRRPGQTRPGSSCYHAAMVVRSITQAKAELSALIEQVQKGKEVILAKAGKPVAKLVPYRGPAAPRKPGAMAGQIWIAPDFDQLPDDIAESFGIREPKV